MYESTLHTAPTAGALAALSAACAVALVVAGTAATAASAAALSAVAVCASVTAARRRPDPPLLPSALLPSALSPSALLPGAPGRAARDERGEGVISAAIAVLIIASLGALMWVGFKTLWENAEETTNSEIAKIGK